MSFTLKLEKQVFIQTTKFWEVAVLISPAESLMIRRWGRIEQLHKNAQFMVERIHDVSKVQNMIDSKVRKGYAPLKEHETHSYIYENIPNLWEYDPDSFTCSKLKSTQKDIWQNVLQILDIDRIEERYQKVKEYIETSENERMEQSGGLWGTYA